jgi:hypothetical protein
MLTDSKRLTWKRKISNNLKSKKTGNFLSIDTCKRKVMEQKKDKISGREYNV